MRRRQRNKSTDGKKPCLLFTESPVNIVHSIPSPALASDHPATADVVPVEDANVTWVSPHFEGAQVANDRPVRKRARNISSRTTRASGPLTPGKGQGPTPKRHAAKFKPLIFVQEGPSEITDVSSDEEITYKDDLEEQAPASKTHLDSPCFPKTKQLTAKKPKRKKKVLSALKAFDFSESEEDNPSRSQHIEYVQNDSQDDIPSHNNEPEQICNGSKEPLKSDTLQTSESSDGMDKEQFVVNSKDPNDFTSLDSMLNTTKQMRRQRQRVEHMDNEVSYSSKVSKRSLKSSPSPMDITGVLPLSSRKGKVLSRRLFKLQKTSEEEVSSTSDSEKENLRMPIMRGRRVARSTCLFDGKPCTSTSDQDLASKGPSDVSIRYQTPPNPMASDVHQGSPKSDTRQLSLKTPHRQSLRIKNLREQAAMFFNAQTPTLPPQDLCSKPPLVYDTPEEDYGLPVRLRQIKYTKINKLEFL